MYEKSVNLREREFAVPDLAQLIQRASQFSATSHLQVGERRANAKSLLGLMALDLSGADEIIVQAEGEEAQVAVEAIAALLEQA